LELYIMLDMQTKMLFSNRYLVNLGGVVIIVFASVFVIRRWGNHGKVWNKDIGYIRPLVSFESKLPHRMYLQGVPKNSASDMVTLRSMLG